MTAEPLSTLTDPESELVIGLVYAVGTDDRPIVNTLADGLKQFGYKVHEIRLSSFLKRFDLKTDLKDEPEYERIDSFMKAGNEVCVQADRADFLALVGISEINKTRPLSLEKKAPSVLPKTVHIILSLKRPQEVAALRRVYGQGFYLVGVFATEQDRLKYLSEVKGMEAEKANLLNRRDQEEKEAYGQRTRDTFHLADVFVRLEGDEYRKQLIRFLDLVFGIPVDTPTQDENAMFLAYGASLRSGQLSRQVGAAIATQSGDVVAVGCNDVPRAGGGLYWPGPDDQRDHLYRDRVDTNELYRNEIVENVLKRLQSHMQNGDLVKEGRALLQDSPLMQITEYGRAVHAEMEAILACARAGISPIGHMLYATTYPCHNCARHIIAAGISRVVYIEPYSRSRAMDLHSDSMETGRLMLCNVGLKNEKEPQKVILEPFVGVGPRRYFDLFSMKMGSGYPIVRKNKNGSVKEWKRTGAQLRVPMSRRSYLELEELAIGEIQDTMKALEEKEGD